MAAHPSLTTRNKVGLGLAALLALADLGLPRAGLIIGFGLPDPEDAANRPLGWGILIFCLALALTTLIAGIHTWFTANRVGVRVIAGTRIIAVLLAVPVLAAGDLGVIFGVPAVPFVVAHVLVTTIAVTFLLSRARRHAVS